MSKSYTFKFKQKDICLEFVTTDREFVDREMEKWINTISNTKITTKPVELKNNNIETKKVDKIDKVEVFDEKIRNEETNNEGNFSEILQERIESPAINAVKEKEGIDSSLNEFIKNKNPDTLVDYLVCAACYLYECEKIEHFSIKQINSEIFKLIKKPVDHSVIQQAVLKDYIKVVPDFTGMANVTEYAITEMGEEYFINEL